MAGEAATPTGRRCPPAASSKSAVKEGGGRRLMGTMGGGHLFSAESAIYQA